LAGLVVAGPARAMVDAAMRRLELANGVLFSLTDAEPPPAPWSYSFPDARLADHPRVVARWLPDGLFHTRFTSFAFERNGRIILVDAGIGAGASEYFDGLSGRLADEMAAAGLDIGAVEHVIFTHFHLDHVGWATGRDGKAFFPNARYHAPSAELDHWRAMGDRAALPHHVKAFHAHITPLLESGRLAAEDAGTVIAAIDGTEVTYRAVPGHTAGHSAVVIAGGGETVVIAGDSWHSPAQIAVPEWCHRADREPAMARQSRKALAQWARDRRAVVAAGHFGEEICFGRIEADDAGAMSFAPYTGTGG
jgi:glyoxylase-like metal-dependent hydrolase (beta-lactamase superfamily II)